MSNLYDILGVKPEADQPTIKRAYRKRARKAHPDKGGSNDEMAAVNHAYGVLSDEQRRLQYDVTGDTEEQAPQHIRTNQIMVAAFEQFVIANTFDDPISWCVRHIEKQLQKFKQDRRELQQGIDFMMDRRGAIKRKGAGEDLYLVIIEREIARMKAIHKSLCECIEDHDVAIKRVRDEYQSGRIEEKVAGLLARAHGVRIDRIA